MGNISLEDFKNHYYFNLLEYHEMGKKSLHLVFRVPVLETEEYQTININIVGDNSENERRFEFNQVAIDFKIHNNLSFTMGNNKLRGDSEEGYSIIKKLIIAKSVFKTTFTEFIKKITEQLIPDYLNNLNLYNNHGGFIEAKPYWEELKSTIDMLINNIETKTNNPFKQSKKIVDFDLYLLLDNIKNQEKKKLFGTLSEKLDHKLTIKAKKI